MIWLMPCAACSPVPHHPHQPGDESPFCWNCGALYPDRAQVRVELARMIRRRVAMCRALPPLTMRSDPAVHLMQDLDAQIERVARELRLPQTAIGREFDRAWRNEK